MNTQNFHAIHVVAMAASAALIHGWHTVIKPAIPQAVELYRQVKAAGGVRTIWANFIGPKSTNNQPNKNETSNPA